MVVLGQAYVLTIKSQKGLDMSLEAKKLIDKATPEDKEKMRSSHHIGN